MIQVVYKTDVGFQNFMDNIGGWSTENLRWFEEDGLPFCEVSCFNGTVFFCSRSRENLTIQQEAEHVMFQAESVEEVPIWFTSQIVNKDKVFLFRENGHLYSQ